eukprot:3558537-Rhodomonas_salina.1
MSCFDSPQQVRGTLRCRRERARLGVHTQGARRVGVGDVSYLSAVESRGTVDPGSVQGGGALPGPPHVLAPPPGLVRASRDRLRTHPRPAEPWLSSQPAAPANSAG